MATISLKLFTELINQAENFILPKMNAGTTYLYDNIYKQLSSGEDVKLSSIDFDTFKVEDVDSLSNLHLELFERNSYKANGVISTLEQLAPTCRAVEYV